MFSLDLRAIDQLHVMASFFEAMICLGVGRPLKDEIPCGVHNLEARLKSESEECAREQLREYDEIGPVLPIPTVFIDVPGFAEEWRKHRVSRQSHIYSVATIARLLKEFSKGMELMFLGDPDWRLRLNRIAESVAQACDVTKTGQNVTEERVRQWFWNQMTKRGWWNEWVKTMSELVRKAKARWKQQGDARVLLLTPDFHSTSDDDTCCEVYSQNNNVTLSQKENDFINEISSEGQGERGSKCSGQSALKRKSAMQSHGLHVKRICAEFKAFQASLFDVTLQPVQQHRSDHMALSLDRWFAMQTQNDTNSTRIGPVMI